VLWSGQSGAWLLQGVITTLELSALAWLIAVALVGLLLWWWRVTRPSRAVACAAALAVSLLLAPYAFMIDQAVLLVSVAAIVGLVQDLPPLSRNVILLIVVALASPWYMGALIGLVPINVLRLAPVLVVLAVTILMQAYLRWSVRAPAAVFASAPGS
jgi:ABC-type amino acid transport system permease subunit